MKDVTQTLTVSSGYIHAEVIGVVVPHIRNGKEYRCRICGKELVLTVYDAPTNDAIDSMRSHAEECASRATELMVPLLLQRRYKRLEPMAMPVAVALNPLMRESSTE